MCVARNDRWQSGVDHGGRAHPLRRRRPLPPLPLLHDVCLRSRCGPWEGRGSHSLDIGLVAEDDRIVGRGVRARPQRGADNTGGCPYYFFLGRKRKKPKMQMG